MRYTVFPAIAALFAGMALTGIGPGPAQATHDRQPTVQAPTPPPVVRRPPPGKRQNFRARRTDEIPPWEGFEDCALGIPCVGIMVPTPHPWRH